MKISSDFVIWSLNLTMFAILFDWKFRYHLISNLYVFFFFMLVIGIEPLPYLMAILIVFSPNTRMHINNSIKLEEVAWCMFYFLHAVLSLGCKWSIYNHNHIFLGWKWVLSPASKQCFQLPKNYTLSFAHGNSNKFDLHFCVPVHCYILILNFF